MHALPRSKVDIEDLDEKVILYHFPDFGWMQGVIVGPPDDENETDDDGDIVNWVVYYEEDDSDVPTALFMQSYSSAEKAGPGSWCVINEAA